MKKNKKKDFIFPYYIIHYYYLSYIIAHYIVLYYLLSYTLLYQKCNIQLEITLNEFQAK